MKSEIFTDKIFIPDDVENHQKPIIIVCKHVWKCGSFFTKSLNHVSLKIFWCFLLWSSSCLDSSAKRNSAGIIFIRSPACLLHPQQSLAFSFDLRFHSTCFVNQQTLKCWSITFLCAQEKWIKADSNANEQKSVWMENENNFSGIFSGRGQWEEWMDQTTELPPMPHSDSHLLITARYKTAEHNWLAFLGLKTNAKSYVTRFKKALTIKISNFNGESSWLIKASSVYFLF
jgi:hypothetical protein